jgi:hypothetical protein
MLDSNAFPFRQQYPNGATVYDRTGRRIANVITCNPETGEVVSYDSSQLTRAWIRLVSHLPLQRWWGDVSICSRHGFWPAPLTVRPNMPPPPKHPMCRCVLMPLRPATEADLEVLRGMPITGDTVTVIGINGPHDYFNGSYTVTSVSHNITTL